MNLKIKIAIGAALAIGAGIAANFWLNIRISHAVQDAKNQQELADTKAANAKLELEKKELLAENAKIKQTGDSNNADLESEKSKPATDSQILELRKRLEELAARAGEKTSSPAPPPDKDGNVIFPRLAWRDHQISDDQCMNDLGTCRETGKNDAGIIGNLTAANANLQKEMDKLASQKLPAIRPRNTLWLGPTSDRGGMIAVSHQFKFLNLSLMGGAQASGVHNSRLFVAVGIPFGKP